MESQHLIWLVKNLYDGATGTVRVQNQRTDSFRFEKGVRQGCLISPLLFNSVGEKIMREVENGFPERPGIVIGGRAIRNLRYADDSTLLSRNKEDLSDNMAEKLRVASEDQ